MNGHPCITYNITKDGLDSVTQYLDYAPEQQQLSIIKPLRFRLLGEWDYERLLEQELMKEERERFCQIVQQAGATVRDYYFMLVRNWQWEHQIISLYADYLADQRLIPLNFSRDEYLLQQSIRTFVNRTNILNFEKTVSDQLGRGWESSLFCD